MNIYNFVIDLIDCDASEITARARNTTSSTPSAATAWATQSDQLGQLYMNAEVTREEPNLISIMLGERCHEGLSDGET